MRRKRAALCVAFELLLVPGLPGCAASSATNGGPATGPTWVYQGAKPAMLAINGFNYTDLPIDSFSVGGAGGGNIFVSSPTSGGGKTTCCVMLYPGALLPQTFTVRWMRYLHGRDRWCEKTAILRGPIPDSPTDIGVHFMPDGDIQLEIAHGYPAMKLHIDNFDDGHRKAAGNVIHDEEVGRCKDEP